MVGEAILSAMHPRGEKFLTMICDNGKDYAHYFLFADLLDANFAHLHNSWERGLNENTDGLIRHYFRKSFCFADLTDEDVALVQNKPNSRSIKCFDYATSNDIFTSPPPISLTARICLVYIVVDIVYLK